MDRKVLAAIAYDDAASFAAIVQKVQAALLTLLNAAVSASKTRRLRSDRGRLNRAALSVYGTKR